jgi:hypothetical protein
MAGLFKQFGREPDRHGGAKPGAVPAAGRSRPPISAHISQCAGGFAG